MTLGAVHVRLAGLAVSLLCLLLSDIAAGLDGRAVYADGKPAPGVVVYAIPDSQVFRVNGNRIMAAEGLPRAISAHDGRFTIPDAEPGAFALFARDMEDQCVYVPTTQVASLTKITVPAPSRLEVEVYKGKEPVGGEVVHAGLLAGACNFAYSLSATTNAAGKATLRGLLPGQYLIQTIDEVPQVGCSFRSVVTKQERVTLAPGESAKAKLGGTDLPYLTGRVTDTAGKPLHGVWVRLDDTGPQGCCATSCGADSGPATVWSDVTTREGHYALYDVPPGEHEIVCFRRLALNSATRTFEAAYTITVPPSSEKTPVENVCDIVVDLEPFMPFGIGQAAPPIQGELLTSEPFSLAAQRGKVVVIHFYAHWCLMCAGSLPDFDELAERYPGEVIVLGISLGKTEALCREYAAKKQIRHPIIYDGPWRSSRLREALRVCDVPSSIIVDPQGNISQVDLFGDVLARHVETLINSTAS